MGEFELENTGNTYNLRTETTTHEGEGKQQVEKVTIAQPVKVSQL